VNRCISILMISAFISLALPAFGMSCKPGDEDCPKAQERLIAVLSLSRLAILKTQCSRSYPDNASAYEAGFDQFFRAIKGKLPDIADIQKTQEYRVTLEENEKDVAHLSSDKFQAECAFLLNGMKSR
jgi:hypothetical protein